MNRSVKMSKNFIIFVIILPFMTLLSIFIYSEYIKTKETVFKIIQEHLINEKVTLLENYANSLSDQYGKNIQNLHA